MTTQEIENFDKDVVTVIEDWFKNDGFKARKLTDTPTDTLQVVNKGYVDNNQKWAFLGQQTLSGNAASISVTVEAKPYIKILAYLAGLSGSIGIKGTFNGDTGNNYNTHLVEDGGPVSRDSSIAFFRVDNVSNAFDRFINLDIYNPATTTKRFSGFADSMTDAASAGYTDTLTGLWNNTTDQITTITFTTSSGTIGANSTLLVFGANNA